MNSITRYISPLFISFGFISFGLCAEPVDDTLAYLGSESLFLEELPIVISATRLSQPLNESPVSTTIIDRQMIDASGAQTIADVLRLVPGFSVGYISGNQPVATYHGHSERLSKRIQLVIDGRSVYLPTLSGVSWSDLVITIDDIERIEIVRGPNASAYGNNAFLAVVSITTRHAAEDQGHYVKNTVGSHDTSNVIYRFGGQFDELDYRVSIGTKNDEGTDLLDDMTETDYFSYRLDYQLDSTTQLFYQGGMQDSVYGDVLEDDTDSPNDFDVTTAFQHIKLEHSFDNDSSLSLQYYYNYTKSYNSSLRDTISPAIDALGTPLESIVANIDDFDIYLTLDLESERHDFELDYYYNPLDSLRLVSGASVRADRVDAGMAFDPGTDNTLWLYRLFTHGEYSFTENWLLNAGLMVEKNDISDTDIAPRLGIIHHLNPQHSLRLSASKATRTPTLFDENGYYAMRQQLTQDGGQPLNNPLVEAALGGDTLINTIIYTSGGVQSEEITSFEFGWMAQLLDNKLTLDIKLFADETQKLIAEIPFLGDVPTENVDDLLPGNEYVGAIDFVNAAVTNSQGLELYSDYRINQDLRLYGYFSYIEIEAKICNDNITDNERSSIVGQIETSAPRRSYGLMLMKQWENHLNTSLAIYHVSEMDWIDRTRDYSNSQPFNDRSAEAYTKVDLVVRKSVVSGNSQVDFSFILQNLGGSHFDYTRTSYTDQTLQTVSVPGSEQDPRGYFELAFKFN